MKELVVEGAGIYLFTLWLNDSGMMHQEQFLHILEQMGMICHIWVNTTDCTSWKNSVWVGVI